MRKKQPNLLRPRWRKILLDLWHNKVRSLLAIASIAVGVFAIGMIAGSYAIIWRDIRTDYASVNPANIEIVTDAFEPGYVKTVRRLDGVAWAEGRRLVTVRVETAPGVWEELRLEAIHDFDDARINRLRPLQGAAVPRNREVILEGKTAEALGAVLGDELTIELPDGTQRAIPVTGLAQDPTYSYGALLGDAKGYITYETLDWLHYPLSLNRLTITVTERPDDKQHITEMAGVVANRVERNGRRIYDTRLSGRTEHPLASIIQALLGC